MWTDRQTDRGALQSIAVHCGPLQKHRRTLPYYCDALWTIMVRCSELRKRCGRQTTVVHYDACSACIAPCGGVYHILSHLAIIAVHYGNITGTSGTSGTLADHCDALQCIAVHCSASSTCCGGVHHTLTETPNSIHLSHHPANPQKLTANP